MFNRRRFLLTSATLATMPSLEAQSPASVARASPAVAALTNRAGEAVPITLGEREDRFERARQLMHQPKIAALCITGGTSLAYFTGIRWGQSERLFAFVLPYAGAPFIVCPVFEEDRVRERLTSVPDGARTRIYTWNEDEDPYALTAKALREAGVSTGSLGSTNSATTAMSLGMDERVQFVFADRLAQALPALRVVSAIPVIAGCRSIKSAAELALMRLANAITLQVYEAAWKSAHPGMTNRDFTDLIAQGFARCGVQGEASCQAGSYSALPHGSISPQTIREGEMVLIDDGCSVEGYQSDISRSFVYGKPSDRQKRVFDIVHRAQAAALAAARPGVLCQDIDAAAREVVTSAGFGPDYAHFTHRVGHGIGMDGHEWPYLVRGNTQALAAGMTFSDEPGLYLKGEFGIRLEDDWFVTPDGAEMFTPTSPSLEHPFAKPESLSS